MKITVDRFEENYAVCYTDDSLRLDIPSVLLEGASEGDVYDMELKKLPEERKKRHASIEEKAKKLWAD